MTTFLDTADNFHPWECNGPGHCIHCDRRRLLGHDPRTCALCAETDLDEEEDMSGVLSEAADALDSVSERLRGLDFSQEKEALQEAVGTLSADIGEVIASLRGFVEQVGDPQSVPQAGTVDNPAEPFEGAETAPADNTEPAEGAAVIENEPPAE